MYPYDYGGFGKGGGTSAPPAPGTTDVNRYGPSPTSAPYGYGGKGGSYAPPADATSSTTAERPTTTYGGKGGASGMYGSPAPYGGKGGPTYLGEPPSSGPPMPTVVGQSGGKGGPMYLGQPPSYTPPPGSTAPPPGGGYPPYLGPPLQQAPGYPMPPYLAAPNYLGAGVGVDGQNGLGGPSYGGYPPYLGPPPSLPPYYNYPPYLGPPQTMDPYGTGTYSATSANVGAKAPTGKEPVSSVYPEPQNEGDYNYYQSSDPLFLSYVDKMQAAQDQITKSIGKEPVSSIYPEPPKSMLPPGGNFSDDGNWYFPPMPTAPPGTMISAVMPQPIWVGQGAYPGMYGAGGYDTGAGSSQATDPYGTKAPIGKEPVSSVYPDAQKGVPSTTDPKTGGSTTSPTTPGTGPEATYVPSLTAGLDKDPRNYLPVGYSPLYGQGIFSHGPSSTVGAPPSTMTGSEGMNFLTSGLSENEWDYLYANKDLIQPGTAEWGKLVLGANMYNPLAKGTSGYKGSD